MIVLNQMPPPHKLNYRLQATQAKLQAQGPYNCIDSNAAQVQLVSVPHVPSQLQARQLIMQ